MASTDVLVDKARDNMQRASEADRSLDEVVYYSNQALAMLLNAVVLELRELRQEVSKISR